MFTIGTLVSHPVYGNGVVIERHASDQYAVCWTDAPQQTISMAAFDTLVEIVETLDVVQDMHNIGAILDELIARFDEVFSGATSQTESEETVVFTSGSISWLAIIALVATYAMFLYYSLSIHGFNG